MASSTLVKLQSIFARQMEAAAHDRAMNAETYGILQHPFVMNQYSSPADMPPSNIISPFLDTPTLKCAHELEVPPLHAQSLTEHSTPTSARWMTECHDVDQLSPNGDTHDNLDVVENSEQGNVNDDAIKDTVDISPIIPEEADGITSLNSSWYNNLNHNTTHRDASHTASTTSSISVLTGSTSITSLPSFTCGSSYEIWWNDSEVDDTKSAQMSDEEVQRQGISDLIFNTSYNLNQNISDLGLSVPHGYSNKDCPSSEQCAEARKHTSFASMIDELLIPHLRRYSISLSSGNDLANLSHPSGIMSICENMSLSGSGIFAMSEEEITYWVTEVAQWEEEEEMKENEIM